MDQLLVISIWVPFKFLWIQSFSFLDEDENESESMEIDDGLVEEDRILSITLPVIIASTPSISPKGQLLVEENVRTVPTNISNITRTQHKIVRVYVQRIIHQM